MTVVSSILFGIGAAIALMTIWTSYRSALPALRRLKHQLDGHAEAADVRWTCRENAGQPIRPVLARTAARRGSRVRPRRRSGLTHHHAT